MRRYRDPTPAIKQREPDLPLREKVWCIIVVTVLVVASVWVSVMAGRHP